jgi:hypothetical protein
VVALLLTTNLVGYHLGKDCGAWEAKERLKGHPKPAWCFTAP